MNTTLQKIASVFFYTIPLKESLPFGYYWFYKYSFFKFLLLLTFPLEIIESSIPFGGLFLFIIIYLGLVRNQQVPYFVRFNAFQAILLNISLIIIRYLLKIFPLTEFNSLTFILILAIFIFSIIKCLLGSEPEIPLISKSVRMQI